MFRPECVDMAGDVDIGGIGRLPKTGHKRASRNRWGSGHDGVGKTVVAVNIYIVVRHLLLDRPVFVELMRPCKRRKKTCLQVW